MTPDIERLAKEAGIVLDYYYIAKDLDVLAKFAALISEECAKECDILQNNALSAQKTPGSDDLSDLFLRHHACAHSEAAAAIRAKFALSSDKPEAK